MTNNIITAHEEASVIQFLKLYNDLKKSSICFLRLGDPHKQEPDCICSNNTAIEVVGTYDNEYQARRIWNDARGIEKKEQPQLQLLTYKNLESEIASKLEKLNNKNYDGFSGKIFLLCNLHSPLLTDSDVDVFTTTYIPFKTDSSFNRYFNEIWITWNSQDYAGWKIRRLE